METKQQRLDSIANLIEEERNNLHWALVTHMPMAPIVAKIKRLEVQYAEVRKS